MTATVETRPPDHEYLSRRLLCGAERCTASATTDTLDTRTNLRYLLCDRHTRRLRSSTAASPITWAMGIPLRG